MSGGENDPSNDNDSSDDRPVTQAQAREIAREIAWEEACMMMERFTPLIMDTLLQGFERMGFAPSAHPHPPPSLEQEPIVLVPLPSTVPASTTAKLPTAIKMEDDRNHAARPLTSSSPLTLSDTTVSAALPTPPHSHMRAQNPVPQPVTPARTIHIVSTASPSAAGPLTSPRLYALAVQDWTSFLDALLDPIYPRADGLIPTYKEKNRKFYVVFRGFKTGVFHYHLHAWAATKLCNRSYDVFTLPDAISAYDKALHCGYVAAETALAT